MSDLEKINNRDLKIIELKEELKQLEKNYNDNNRNLINRYQNSNKINNKNVFLFYNSRNGNNIGNNKNNKKENKIVNKNNNNKGTKNKSNEKKKAKSTPKIGGFMNDIKNNYFFMMSNKKCHNLNFGVKMGMGKSLDYKKNSNNNNKSNSNNNNYNINSQVLKNNNVKIVNYYIS